MFECGNVSMTSSTTLSPFYGGRVKPNRTTHSGDTAISNAYFPVIIVFVQFHDSPGFFDWPAPNVNSGKPIFLDSMIAGLGAYNGQTDWWDAYSQYTQRFSDRWLEVSRGKFHVLGKAYSVVLSDVESKYDDEYEMNQEILDSLEAQGVVWNLYDKWGYDNTNHRFTHHRDGYVDMIYRMTKSRAPGMNQDYGGYNTFAWNYSGNHRMIQGGDTTRINASDNYICSGVTMAGWLGYNNLFGGFIHEHGHNSFSGGHSTYSTVSYGFGFDGFFSPNDFVANGYMQDTVFDYSSSTDFLLEDYASRNQNFTGNLLRLPTGGSDFFALAFRGQTYWDRVMTGDTAIMNFYKAPEEYNKGLYIYHFSKPYKLVTSDTSFADMECADGYYEWEEEGWHYQTIPQTCFQSAGTPWPYYKPKRVLYFNDSSRLEKQYTFGDGISFHHTRYVDGRWKNFPKWWAIGKKEANSCELGTNRIFVNQKEVYTNSDVGGERYDAWRPGYNEVFSPYSSPSSCAWNNSYTGVFVWYYTDDHDRAALKIYRDVNAGGDTDLETILEETPPSRPMGIKLDTCYNPGSGFNRIKITWNHNMEPDMNRTIGENVKKRYKVYRSKSADSAGVPMDALTYSEYIYTLLATVDIDSGTVPSYVDTANCFAYCNELPDQSCPPTCWKSVNVRYRVQAVDVYDDVSNLSDFASCRAYVNNPSGTPSGDEDGFGRPKNDINIPTKFDLHQNYPNPFNPVTNIQYDLPKDNFVTIKIYDLLGKEVALLINEFKQAGRYVISFNANKLASGVYFYKIEATDFIDTKRMVLVK
ncbi:MAG: T9SS type A sorting domain-containing protein [Bacteroidetes bacterium]|nr:T9SS type A sorting domain-containing protein [Bacteroidota bacterium]